MAEQESKKAEVETPVTQPEKSTHETPTPVAEVYDPPEEAVVEFAPMEETTSIQKVTELLEEKFEEEDLSKDTFDKNAKLARVETEKRMSLIKAWEESEKCKAQNKAHKKIAIIEAWENIKKASLEAQLRKIEQCLEKKKAEYTEKMKNKVAMIHKQAEERKAVVEAKRCENLLKVDEIASKCRTIGKPPKKLLILL
ncbi:hypothetical protein RND81_12G114000 [Saponaria officinalis]|uniref:Remorin C-terminal domain-containing protein n=1 Tax=Saponaria officinalis TaxID=3572 RepID=A0AAW1H9A7_SAPOF